MTTPRAVAVRLKRVRTAWVRWRCRRRGHPLDYLFQIAPQSQRVETCRCGERDGNAFDAAGHRL